MTCPRHSSSSEACLASRHNTNRLAHAQTVLFSKIMADCDSDSDSNQEKCSRKRSTVASSGSGKTKRHRPSVQSFKRSYSEEWPCLVSSQLGLSHAFCGLCRSDFSVTHGGRDDCRRHVESAKHKQYAVAQKNSQSIAKMFSKPANEEEHRLKVVRAEATMASLIAELNLPMTAADKITVSVKKMFPDSKIAADFHSGRSKTTAMIKELAKQHKQELKARMQQTPFTISTDGSNDAGAKQFPLVVRTFNPDTLQVTSDVLAVPVLMESATGENIAQLITKEFEDGGIPWKNCLALGADNANVMTGHVKGVYGFLKKKQEDLYMAGCVCHLIHICAEKAAACLPINIDEFLVDIYYYLDKSSLRHQALSDFQIKHDIANKKILKHVATRWLSVGKCLPRLLENWRALRDFVSAEKESRKSVSSTNANRLERLNTILKSPTQRLYCYFLVDVLTVFDKVNTTLQSEEPKIQILRKMIRKLFRDLALRFLKPAAIRGVLISQIQFSVPYNQKKDADLLIGDQATKFIEEGHALRAEKLAEFYVNVKKFFCEALSYMKKKLPMEDEFLAHAEVADPKEQVTSKQSSIKFFLNKYPAIMPQNCTHQKLLEEYALYQSTVIEEVEDESADAFWKRVSQMKDADGSLQFAYLPQFMVAILTIPHSSAHCERVFSCVRKNRTDQRASLGEEVLEALMVVKHQPGGCLDMQLKKEDLQALKRCYVESLHK